MKKFSIRALAVLLVVGGLVAVLWPVQNWRLYDANWRPLAMTEAESFCSGYVLGANQFNNKPDPEGVQACIAEHDWYDNTVPKIGVSATRSCEGIFKAVAMPVADCLAVVEGYGLWFLLDGGYTLDWNESHPRPEVIRSDIQNAPRGERGDGGTERDMQERTGF